MAVCRSKLNTDVELMFIQTNVTRRDVAVTKQELLADPSRLLPEFAAVYQVVAEKSAHPLGGLGLVRITCFRGAIKCWGKERLLGRGSPQQPFGRGPPSGPSSPLR